MATKRTPLLRSARHRITPEAVAAFDVGDWMALHRALGLRPWQASPLDASTPEPPAGCGPNDAWRESWPLARVLRADLQGSGKGRA